MDPEIIQGIMCIFLFRYVLKAKGNGPRDPSRTYVYVCVFLFEYVLKAQRNRPMDHSRTYVYIPRCICIKSLRK